MGNILRRLMGGVFMAPEGDGGGGGAGGAGGGAGGGGAHAPAFADPAAARGFLKEFVQDDGALAAIPDDKAVVFATGVKGRFDGLAKEFPATWRDIIAGENKDHLKTLERFASPKAMYESYSALRSKIASGEYRAIEPFPDKGTPEQQAAWRSANGIPGSAEEYTKSLKFPQNAQITDDDKATFESFAKAAQERNIPPSAYQATVDWYLAEKQSRMETEAARHVQDRQQAEDALRAEWGQDYRPNQNRVVALIDTLPKELAEGIKGARLANGRMLLNDPGAFKWLVDVSRQFNPAGAVIPAGGNVQQSITDELSALDKLMKENRPEYNKKEGRYRELLEAYGKITGKSWPEK